MLITGRSVSAMDFDGLRIFDYTRDHSLSSSLAIVEVEPGAQHREAWSRRSDKYYLVTRGEIDFIIEGSRYAMTSGDFCFVEQGKRFSYSNRSAEPATLVLFHTPGFALEDEVFVSRPQTPPEPRR